MREVAFEVGGETGRRILGWFQITTSGDTLIRIMRQTVLYPMTGIRMVGIDDWALKKGRSTLRETGHIQPPKPRVHEPIVLPEPMQEWEIDFGEIYLEESGVFEFFIVVDRGTSRLIYTSSLRWICLMWLTKIPWAQRIWALPFLTVLDPFERYYKGKAREAKKMLDWVRQMMMQLRQ
jgi:hypothetical protein